MENPRFECNFKINVDNSKIKVDNSKINVDNSKINVDNSKIKVGSSKIKVDNLKIKIKKKGTNKLAYLPTKTTSSNVSHLMNTSINAD